MLIDVLSRDRPLPGGWGLIGEPSVKLHSMLYDRSLKAASSATGVFATMSLCHYALSLRPLSVSIFDKAAHRTVYCLSIMSSVETGTGKFCLSESHVLTDGCLRRTLNRAYL